MGKILISLVFLIVSTSSLYAHPDGSKPYWYPSQFIYGFIHTCAHTIENEKVPLTKKLWPNEIRNVCGCVIDGIRHSLTYQEATSKKESKVNMIGLALMPICINEQVVKNKL